MGATGCRSLPTGLSGSNLGRFSSGRFMSDMLVMALLNKSSLFAFRNFTSSR